MALLIFLSGIAIWVFLERQQVRHKKEMELEYARLNFPPPPAPPGLPLLEALLNVVLGVILAGYSLVAIMTLFLDTGRYTLADEGKLAAVIMAAGIVMITVGVRRLAQWSSHAAAPAGDGRDAGGEIQGSGGGK